MILYHASNCIVDINTIDLYFSCNISKDEALRRLVFIHPNHQICILNQEVINRHLRFIKAEEIKL